jgi:hypothetical protein
MSEKISNSEKLDIFLALEIHFKGRSDPPENKIREFHFRNWPVASEVRMNLEKKTARFNLLNKEKKEIWQTLWIEKIKKRGQTKRLDETIHPEQIARVLKDEPLMVLLIIQEKLPDLLVNQVANILQNQELITFLQKKTISKKNVFIPAPGKEILALVRQRFLNNFVAFEDLYQTFEVDKLSPQKLGNFIWNLGIREIAIYCRKIKTKEDLANFLTDFEEGQKKEIVAEIRNLRQIAPIRVRRAENLINEIFLLERFPDEKIRGLGLRVLSTALSQRDTYSQNFTIQKLPVEIGNTLRKSIFTSVREFADLTNPEKAVYLEFNAEIFDLASEFLKDFLNETKIN